MARLEPCFSKSRGKPRVVDRRVCSGIIFINRDELRWRDAPAGYGPAKTLCNRWKRWRDKGVFARSLLELARASDATEMLMIPSRDVASQWPAGQRKPATSRPTAPPPASG